jgi:excisionase family DNA binding protein
MSSGRYGTVKEACQYGRFGLTKCYELINQGKIDAVKDGTKTTLIDLDSIDRYQKALPKFVPGSKKPGSEKPESKKSSEKSGS